MEVNEGAHLIGEPGKRHFILAAACLELFDTPIGEVHVFLVSARARRVSAGVVVALRATQSWRIGSARNPWHCAHPFSDHQRAPPTLAEMFLGSAVGSSRLCESGLHQGTLLLQMHRG